MNLQWLFGSRKKKDLLKEQAAVEVETFGSRTPSESDDDLIRRYGFTIYDRMMQDAHVRACLNLKRLGTLSVPWRLEIENGNTVAQTAVAQQTLAFVQFNLENLQGGVFALLWRVLDAFAKGFSVLEKLYTIAETAPWQGKYLLTSFKAKDPALFGFDLDEFRNVRALVLHQPNGQTLTLPREKFILYTYGNRYESPFGEPDLRAAYKHWWSKEQVLKLWNIYLEKYASPTLLGIYKRGLPSQLQEELLRALDRVQQETAIIVPEEVQVKSLEFGQGGADSYAEAITYHNAEIAKSLLGETLTTDEGQRVGSLALGEVHFKVLKMQLRALRQDLAERVIQDQVVRPLVELNFGNAPIPRFLWDE